MKKIHLYTTLVAVAVAIASTGVLIQTTTELKEAREDLQTWDSWSMTNQTVPRVCSAPEN